MNQTRLSIIIRVAVVGILVITGGYFAFVYNTCEWTAPPSMGKSDPHITERDGKLFYCSTPFERFWNRVSFRAAPDSDQILPTAVLFTGEGKIVCLPHRDPNDRTEECTIGLLVSDGKYYGLKNLDQQMLAGGVLQTGQNVEITGMLRAAPRDRYDVVGNIDVTAAIPITVRFPDKIVYTSNQSADIKSLEAHCAGLGGTFSLCGSSCATDAEVCVEVCAFTCEFSSRGKTSTPSLPTACKDEPEGVPVITSLSRYSGPVGIKLEIRGCNFSGFEGDKNAWIENSQGVKGRLYGEAGSTSKLLKVTLTSPLCQEDTSYSGLPCGAWLTLTQGIYKIYAMPWGKKSNEVSFSVK